MPAFERQQSPTQSSEPVRAARADRTVSRLLHADIPLLAQQRTLGNQAVQRLLLSGALQAKLRVGQPNDAYEQEADRVADTVMRMPEPEVQRQRAEEGEEEEEGIQTEPLADGITPLVQRQAETPPEEEEEEEPPQAEPAPGQVQPLVQRQEAEPAKEEEEEEEEPQAVQPKAKGAGITHVRDAALVQRLRSPEGGAPLPGGARSFFERRFGYDFSGVRIHDAYRDRADVASLNARAFTYGKHIWLGHGESTTDSRLMAHELTHVVQQNAGVRRRPLAVSPVTPRIQRIDWWDRVKETVGGAISSLGELVGDAKATVLGKLAQWAKSIPGFDLLTVILNKDPITDQPVERNAINLTRGVLGLLGPPGIAMFENLEKSGAIARAFEWFNTEISKLNLTWDAIKGLFRTAWNALSLADLANPSGALEKLRQIFGPPLARLRDFAFAAGRKVLEFVFEGALSLAGGFGTRVMGIVRRAGAVFTTIINDPIGFLGNLVAAVRGGFERFYANIWTHLKTGLIEWLLGSLRGAGLTLPDKWDLKGFISIIVQVLGLSYDKSVRPKLVKLIGEGAVGFIEGVFDFVKTLVTGGLSAAWEKILEYAGNLQEMVIGAIRDWVAKSVVGAAITKLITMFNPVGAVIQGIITIYNTIMFFIERAQQIAALAEAVFDSIANIAAGNIGAAISYVERTMARALPVIIGFLARLIGLGNISGQIRAFIERVQTMVDKAIGSVVDFIVKRIKGLLTRRAAGAPSEQRLERAVTAAQAAVNRFAGRRVGALVLRPLLGAIRLRFRLTSLDVVPQGDHWAVRGEGSPVRTQLTNVFVDQENLPSNGVLDLYRGIAYETTLDPEADEQELEQRLVRERDFAAAVYDILGVTRETSGEVTQQELQAAARLVQQEVAASMDTNRVRQWWLRKGKGRIFDNVFLGMLQRFVNKRTAFMEDLQKREQSVYRGFTFTQIPFISTSKRPERAARYAKAEVVAGPRARQIIQKLSGIVGKVFVYLFSAQDLIAQRAADIRYLEGKGRLSPLYRFSVADQEVTFTGSIPTENRVDEIEVGASDAVPSVASKAKQSATSKAGARGGLAQWDD